MLALRNFYLLAQVHIFISMLLYTINCIPIFKVFLSFKAMAVIVKEPSQKNSIIIVIKTPLVRDYLLLLQWPSKHLHSKWKIPRIKCMNNLDATGNRIWDYGEIAVALPYSPTGNNMTSLLYIWNTTII